MNELLKTFALIACGASMGAGLRFAISRHFDHWPVFLPTFLINSLGSLFMGICIVIIYQKTPEPWSTPLGILCIAGFLGSFTTYSTFSKDLFLSLDKGFWSFIFLASSQVLLGLALFAVGYKVAQYFIRS